MTVEFTPAQEAQILVAIGQLGLSGHCITELGKAATIKYMLMQGLERLTAEKMR